jgi:hypothetical protein
MSPSVAFDGTNYFVVWHDYRNDTGQGNADVYATRVSKDGVVLDSPNILIGRMGGYPSVAFDGANYIVVWEVYKNGSNTYISSLVDTAGNVIEESPILESSFYSNINLYADKGNKLLVYSSLVGAPHGSIRVVGRTFTSPTGAPESQKAREPESQIAFSLEQNYPNPFSTKTTIKYVIRETENRKQKIESRNQKSENRNQKSEIKYQEPCTLNLVTLRIYSITGQLVRTLMNSNPLLPGEYSIVWDGRDENKKEVSSGIYFYKLQVESNGKEVYNTVRKMVVVR